MPHASLRLRSGQTRLTAHLPALLVLAAFVSLAVIYSLVTPPFEAGDESRHYAVVKYMADTGRLPVQQEGEAQRHWSHEGNQPPLYYALAAALTGWIETGDWADVYWYNPHTTIGNPLRPDNKNITIQPPGAGWPWRHHVLAVHLIRFLSIAMAAVTVFTAYLIALRLFRGNRWLATGAMAVTAFNPMFIFIAAAINNDNAVIMFVTLTLYLLTGSRAQESDRTGGSTPEMKLVWGGTTPQAPRSATLSRESDRTGGSTPGMKLVWGETTPQAPRSATLSRETAIEAARQQRVTKIAPLPASPRQDEEQSSPPTATAGRTEGGNRYFQGSRRHIGYAALLGLLIGLGALSKLYALGLLPLAGLRLLWLACAAAADDHEGSQQPCYNTRTFWKNALLWNGVLAAVFLAAAGWFYARNAVLYDGDVLALDVMRETAGQRASLPTLATLRAEFEGFRIAYWALFGGVNILADRWIYTVLDWLSLAALLGLLAFTVRFMIYDLRVTSDDWRLTIDDWPTHPPTQPASQPSNHPTNQPPFPPPIHPLSFLILLGWCLIMAAGFIVWNLTQPAGQGRLLYPAIAAISALGMLGLTWWLPPRGQQMIAAGCGLGLFLFAAAAPGLYIAPAYARPPLLSQAGLPADMQPVDFTYDGVMRLVGYQLPEPVVRPAETLPITLYWQALAPAPLDYSIFIHVLGRNREVIGQIDSYPGGGKWPTTLLSPGDIVAGRYEVPIKPEAEFEHAPARLQIAAGIYDFHEPGRPGRPAVNAAGAPVDPIIAAAKLVPWQWPPPPTGQPPVNFFDKATLLGYEIAADQQTVTLTWRADSVFETDYTVFLQVWDTASGQYVTGFDGPPVQGDYPTSFWAPGEIIVDRHRLNPGLLPPGRYDLLAGLYHPATGERLPAFGPDGPRPDYAVNLGQLQISGQ